MEHIQIAQSPEELAETEDRLFRVFDNRRIGIGSESWIAEVYGVHLSDREGWMQLAAKDAPLRSVVVHIWPNTTTGEVTVALSKWALLPVESRPPVIDAMRIDVN